MSEAKPIGAIIEPIISDLLTCPSRIKDAIERSNWIAENGWRYISGLVESPIERLLITEIMADRITTSTTGLNALGRQYIHGEERFLDSHGIICYPQASVGKYRVDFLFDVLLPFETSRQIYVVECDGHAFHERTAEQAERDKTRDRYMTRRGIKVLRYTGREITRSPEFVWREIVDIITANRGPQWAHQNR